MSVPFICDNCDNEKDFKTSYPIYQKCEKCGGKMRIHYQDNYERICEVFPCHTCVHSSEGGEKCNYCTNI